MYVSQIVERFFSDLYLLERKKAVRMAATRRLQKELLDIRREEKETVSIILMSSVRNSLLLFGLNFMCSVADPYHFDADGIRISRVT